MALALLASKLDLFRTLAVPCLKANALQHSAAAWTENSTFWWEKNSTHRPWKLRQPLALTCPGLDLA